MNIDHIEAFLYVVHYKSTHKAASALFLSQPTVTARIKSLERELGVELFYREGRSVTLSDKGKDFLPFCDSNRTNISARKEAIGKDTGNR